MADALISIIVPTYNEDHRPGELIAQLQDVQGANLNDRHEIILVDASDQAMSVSEIETLKIASEAWTGIRVISIDTPGRAVQMNLGVELATGDTLLFLHCDTKLPVGALGRVEQAVRSGYEWGWFDLRLDCGDVIYRIIEKMINLRTRMRRIATGDQAIFTTVSLFKACGGYPEISLMEDVAICSLLKAKAKPAVIEAAVVTSARRWQNRGPVRTILLMWRIRFLFWLGVDPESLARRYKNER